MTDNPKTMTVEEEISDMCKRYATAYIPADMFDEILDVVTRALNQAPKEAQIVCDHQGVCDACIEKYQGQGFEQAREMVAKEMERIGSPSCEWCNSGPSRIRALDGDSKPSTINQPPREGAEHGK